MVSTVIPIDREALLARLATTAYQVALKHGIRGPFAQPELEMWRELRSAWEDASEHAEGDR